MPFYKAVCGRGLRENHPAGAEALVILLGFFGTSKLVPLQSDSFRGLGWDWASRTGTHLGFENWDAYGLRERDDAEGLLTDTGPD